MKTVQMNSIGSSMQSLSINDYLLGKGFIVERGIPDVYLTHRIMVFVYTRYAFASIDGDTPIENRVVSGQIRNAGEIANFCNQLVAEIDRISGE